MQPNLVEKMMAISLVVEQMAVMHRMVLKHLLVINVVLLYVAGVAYSNQPHAPTAAEQFDPPWATVTFDTHFHI